MLSLRFLSRFSAFGLLFMRVGLGIVFVMHGMGKVTGGPELWTQVGSAVQFLGISQYHVVFGFLATFSEFAGGILLILGFLFRPAALFMFATMAIATNMHIHKGDDFTVYSHALSMAIIFFGLMFVGPGKLSIDGE